MACDGVWCPAVRSDNGDVRIMFHCMGRGGRPNMLNPHCSRHSIAQTLQKALANVTWIALLIFQQFIHQ